MFPDDFASACAGPAVTTPRLIGLVLLLATSVTFAAAPPALPPGSAEIQALIDKLADRDYRVREQADKKLVEAGLAALPLLRKAMGHTDPEIRRRAYRMVPKLEHAILVTPKRVTMTVKGKPMRTILDDLSKESGYKVYHMGVMNPGRPGVLGGWAGLLPGGGKGAPKEPTFNYTFVNEPFWGVVDRLCRDGNLSVQQGYGDEAVRFYQTDGAVPHAGHDGAFYYSAMSLQMFKNVDLTAPESRLAAARQESLTFNFMVHAEPRLPFLHMGDVRLEAAYDNEKNSLIPKQPLDPNDPAMMGPNGMFVSRRYYNGYKQGSMQGSFRLERLSEKGTIIKELRGLVPVTLLVEQKPVDLAADDLLNTKNKKTTVGELDFTLDSVTKKPNGVFDVKFTIANRGNPNDYTWQNTIYQRVELVDAKGVKYPNWGSSWGGGGGNNMTMTLTFNGNNGAPKPGPPTRIVFQEWKTRQHDIHFEFKNVPLP